MSHRCRYISFLILLLNAFSLQTLAQEPEAPSALVGVNVAPLWVKSDYYTTALSGQLKVFEKLHVRAQIGFNGSNLNGNRNSLTTNAFFSNGTMDSVKITDPYRENRVFASIGLNWIDQINEDLGVYAGADFLYHQVDRDWTEDLLVTQAFQPNNVTRFHTVTEYETSTRSNGFGLHAGVQYTISSRLLIGLETGFQFFSSDFSEKRDQVMTQWSEFNPQIFTQQNSANRTDRFVEYGFRPVSAAFIYFSL